MVCMTGDTTAFGRLFQPNSDCNIEYRIRMNRDSKQVLWENVSALMKRDFGKENLTAFAKKAGIGPGTATRIKEQTTSVGLDVLDVVAKSFRVKPWHLLLPRLDVANPPLHAEEEGGWPFDKVDRDAYESLPADEQVFVQGHLARIIEERSRARQEVSMGKRRSAGA